MTLFQCHRPHCSVVGFLKCGLVCDFYGVRSCTETSTTTFISVQHRFQYPDFISISPVFYFTESWMCRYVSMQCRRSCFHQREVPMSWLISSPPSKTTFSFSNRCRQAQFHACLTPFPSIILQSLDDYQNLKYSSPVSAQPVITRHSGC